jgi:glucosamine-6-phosphate deaminase
MEIIISKDAADLGKRAAKFTAEKISESIRLRGDVRMAVSTGSSQFELFQALIKENVDWKKVEIFHLDEYINLPVTHKASFRKYLYERFINQIDVKMFHAVNTDGDIDKAIGSLTREIKRKPIDIGLIGIGVNGHIAFNDPPADFNTHDSYIVVSLDDQCKLQQVNEGWFGSLEDVPAKALSMSVWQIMQCKTIISCVPHLVKADAVYKTFMTKTNNLVPASILKQHSDYHLFVDYNSASRVITF